MKPDSKNKTEKTPPKLKTAKGSRRSGSRVAPSNGKHLHPPTTYEHAPIGIVETSLEGTYMNVNEEFCRTVGYTKEELLGRPLKDLTHEEDYPIDMKLHEQLVAGKIPFYRFEKRYLRKDGGEIWVELTRSIVRDEQGNPLYTIGVVLDISERKHVERVLRESVERLRLATEAAQMFTWEWDFLNNSYSLADSFTQVLGFPTDLLSKNAFETLYRYVPAEDLQSASDAFQKVVENQKDLHSLLCRVIHPENGQTVWLEISAKIVYDHEGKPERMFGVAQNVTENKQKEEALSESEERFRALVSQATAGIAQSNLNSRLTFVNPRFCEMLGYSESELLGKTIWELTHTDDLEKNKHLFKRMLEREESYQFEKRFIRKDGSPLWTSVSVSPIRDLAGKPKGGVGVMIDVHERKQAEETLSEFARQQQALYRLSDQLHRTDSLEDVFNAALDAILSALQCDRASVLLFDDANVMRFVAWRGLSGAYRKATDGHSPWKPDTKDPEPISLDDIRTAELEEPLRAIVQQEGIDSLAFIPLVANGKLIGKFMIYFNTPHKFDEDEIDLSLTIANQLAFGIERKRADEALRQSEERYRAVVESQSEMVCRFQPDGKILFVNRAYARARGSTPETLINRNFWEFIPKEDQSDVRAMLDTLTPEAPEVQIENRFETADGERWILWTNRGLTFDANGTLVEAQSSGIDITERKLAEAALRESEERHRGIVNQTIGGIAETDLTGKFIMVNDRFCEITGYTREQLINEMHMQDITHPDDLQSNLNRFGRLAVDGASFEIEKRYVRPDGSPVWVHNSVSAITSADGQPRSAVAVVIDVTERKRIEEALRIENERFMRFITSNIIGILIGNAHGEVILANDYYLNLLGVSRQEFIEGNVDWKKFTPPEWLPADEKAIRELREHGVCEPYEKEYIRLDGTRVPVYIADALLPGPGEEIAAFVIDITERKRAEEQLRRSAEFDAFRVTLTDALRPLSAPQTILAEAMHVIGEKLQVDRVLYSEIQNDDETILIIDNYVKEGVSKLTGRASLSDYGKARGSLNSGKNLIIKDATTSPDMDEKDRASFAALGIRSGLGIPLIKDGRWVATLGVHHSTVRTWTENEIKFMEETAERTWSALERARAQEQLRASETLYRTIARNIPDGGVYVVDKDFRYLVAEGPVTEAFGLSREMLEGHTVSEVFPDERGARMEDRLRRNFAGETVGFETEFNGRVYWTQQAPLQDSIGQAIILTLDITERKRAEEALRQSEERFARFMQHLPGLAWIKDMQGRYVYANATAEKAFNTPREILYGKTDDEIFPVKIASQFKENDQRALAEGQGVQVVEIMEQADGVLHSSLVSKFPIPGPDGNPVLIGGTAFDITERLQAEEALRESEERFSAILRQATVGIVRKDEEGKLIFVNQAFCNMLGYTEEELIGKTLWEFMHPDEVVENEQSYERLMAEGIPFKLERRLLREDGSVIWVDASVSPIMDATGRPQSAVAVEVDITGRKRAEEALRELNLQLEDRVLSRTAKLRAVNQTLREEIAERKRVEEALRQSESAARTNEEKLRTLFDLLPVGISFMDPKGRIIQMNTALPNILRLPKEQILSQPYESRKYIRADGMPMSPSEFASARALAEKKTIHNVETGIFLENGEVVWTNVSAAPVNVVDVGVVVVTVDITESKRAERALQESHRRLRILSQRLVEVQEDERRALARELHDRVGQTLAALNINLIIINSQLLPDSLDQIGPRLNDSMKLVAETIALVRDVMTDLRPSVLDDYGLEAALESHLAQFISRYNINARLEKPDQPLPRLGPSIEMTMLRIAQEALMNIARHAQATQVDLSLRQEADSACLTIRDNGIGIESWQEANRPGSHGLTIMRERAEAFGGSLKVRSFPGQGTVVEVIIPYSGSNPGEAKEKKNA